MAYVFVDRVMETSDFYGDGITVGWLGAVTGYQALSVGYADGDTFDYVIFVVDADGVPTGEWESGLATQTSSPDVIERTAVYANSNGDTSRVNFSGIGATADKRLIVTPSAQTFNNLIAAIVALAAGSNVVDQSGTTYTFGSDDARTYIRFSNASSITATIPPNSSAALSIGTVIELEQAGTGALSVAAGSGVTLLSRGAGTTLAGQYAVAFIRKVAADTWVMSGDI